MANLADKNVVILGATGSVGTEIARRASAVGARTLAVARRRSRLGPLARDFHRPPQAGGRVCYASMAPIVRMFFATVSKQCGQFRLFPTGASTQPAFAFYTQDKTANRWFAHSLHVPDVVDGGTSKLTLFVPPKGLNLTAFGSPLVVETGFRQDA
jgi:hypothetical protein